MLNDLLLSIIDSQAIINIELLEALKGAVDEKQFTKFFDDLKLQDRTGKRIFIKNDFLVSTYRNNNKNNTFIIFFIYQDNPIDKFISGMKDWHIYEEIPF
jgi:hypothetical protein